MKSHWFSPWWLLLLIPVALGLARLRFNVEVLDLLPANVPVVTGVKLFQQNFSNARELIITLDSSDAEETRAAAQAVAEKLRSHTNLVAEVTWRPPWTEHPEQVAGLIAHLWFNQPPAEFAALAARLATTNLAAVLAATRDELATTLSPTDIARLSYDPFGFTRLPEDVAGVAPGFGQGEDLFASPDGRFRVVFVKSRVELADYRECAAWFGEVKHIAAAAVPAGVTIGFTGRPAFVAEVSASMKRDIIVSVTGTAVLIALLFWLAHRRIKPMLWLLALLGVILISTLALGGLLFGEINVVSMGFAAILLGLAVDYAVVHYQEALAHPQLSVPRVRRLIAPGIFWAAATTIVAFLVLNFGGLPGLGQLGSLVAIGVALAALVMIFAYLPPLFPEQMNLPPAQKPPMSSSSSFSSSSSKLGTLALITTFVLLVACAAVLSSGPPRLDSSARALEPRNSPARAALDAVTLNLNENRDPLWLIVAGRDESEVARRLAVAEPILSAAVSNQVLAGFSLPTAIWQRPEFQATNRTTAQQLIGARERFNSAASAAGFSDEALGLTHAVLDDWQAAVASPNVHWPTNPLGTWVTEKIASRGPTNLYAAGFLFPPAAGVDATALRDLQNELPTEGMWLGGWKLLGETLLGVVEHNLWKLVLPMLGLVLLSLWLAFRRLTEVLLSLGVLVLSALCLLAAMRALDWSWNLLNLMAVPLILGTGVDYGLFTQLSLRRNGGDVRMTYRSTGRALLLCGGTAIAGFGMLGLSSNAGMAGLGRVCALGIAANMLIAVYLLPAWWSWANRHRLVGVGQIAGSTPPAKPSSLYSARLWGAALFVARALPVAIARGLARSAATIYWLLAAHRRDVVIQNLLPVLNQREPETRRAARSLFVEFALKLVDLWRYEAGAKLLDTKTGWAGWDHFESARAQGRGVLLVTPHLGNWELGAAYFVRHDIPLLVLTQAEPEAALTEMRQASRARRGVETLVVGEDPFAFVEVIKRLQAGATVALLVDRPPPPTAVEVELFGRPFAASIAAAELARASGCAIVPATIVRNATGYQARILPAIPYDRAAIGDRAARIRLTQEILRAFEPAIRQHVEQWFHFVPILPKSTRL